FILFSANPTAGMDWSDTAIASNYRVMMQMATMPDRLLGWTGSASSMDTWMLGRLKQRCEEFQLAMDNFDLRRAVEISHYEFIKDINWYVRRGGENSKLGLQILHSWTHLVSVSTPHLAEEWWETIGMEGLVCGTEMEKLAAISGDEQSALDCETLLRSVLDSARRIKDVAERHLDGPAQSAIIVVSPTWKRTMAVEALDFIEQGGSPKKFVAHLSQMEIAQGERKGEIIGYWGKKMLPQVFKWDDASRVLLRSDLDEVEALSLRAHFIAEELGLQSVQVVLGESPEDETGRAGGSLPLAPAIVYA
ncbi:MAG: class I tRNA ligase family protein, partial [Euryarchaeota archaeon]|nr:class I tRNA ligase family protein [Euryarchaeota archaeon]